MKTSELTGAALDWAVAKCEGHDVIWSRQKVHYIPLRKRTHHHWTPTTNWKQGGSIVERERICISQTWPDDGVLASIWVVTNGEGRYAYKTHGPTPLIAAMRCYVTSKLGDEVEIPEKLT